MLEPPRFTSFFTSIIMPKSKVSASACNKAIDPTRAATNSKVLKTRDAAKTKTKNTKATVCTNEELEIATASRGDVILMGEWEFT